ncbi:DUF4810 domain-containing protein [Ferrigenium sp. UT5]|uniref:DUF4810 domain-containing protein n=1 Tax=Ferrigenium sp. UT5 TaxID=3242105 RepID=UPI00354FB3F5
MTPNNIYRTSALATGVFALALLSGCAHPPETLYYWGEYQPVVYAHFNQGQTPEEQIQALEADVEKARAANKPLPPGEQAHLGLLYGLAGQTDRMRAQLVEEKTRFPESGFYIDFLLKNSTKSK